MTNRNPRINVTFEQSTVGILAEIAKGEHRSVSSLIKQLTHEALELREDMYFSKLAEKLDKSSAKRYSHEEAWK